MTPWSAAGVHAEAAAIATQERQRPAPAFHQRRDVAVGYTVRAAAPTSYVASRQMAAVDPLSAVALILEDLALSPEWLIVRRIQCAGDVPALLLAPRGHTARVVAIIRQGLTEADLNQALLQLTPAGVA